MLRFHAHLFARPAFFVTFEEAQARLTQIPRMDTEPDGFFLIAGVSEGQRWVLNGQLFEFGERLHRVELRGACPPRIFDDLLGCFGWPEVEVVFELAREGATLDEASFRNWAAR